MPRAWLAKVAGRVCLDLLGSARARRERYVGRWLPEPVPGRAEWVALGSLESVTRDPVDAIAVEESVTTAFLVVLESMTPAERVAFVLHDVFRYSFAEVAEALGRSPAACRQLASSARGRVRDSRDAPVPPVSRQADVVRQLREAWEAMSVEALIGVLDPSATAVADGGGIVPATTRRIRGGEELAHVLMDIVDRAPAVRIVEEWVNARPGLVARLDGATVAVLSVDVAGDRVRRIWAVRNPEKLRRWNVAPSLASAPL